MVVSHLRTKSGQTTSELKCTSQPSNPKLQLPHESWGAPNVFSSQTSSLFWTSLRSIGTLHAKEYRKAIAPGKRRYFKRKGGKETTHWWNDQLLCPCQGNRNLLNFKNGAGWEVDYMAFTGLWREVSIRTHNHGNNVCHTKGRGKGGRQRHLKKE